MLDQGEDHNSISVHLSRDEALVLFEFLAREAEAGAEVLRFEHPAELHALWRVEAQLEKALTEIFSPSYGEILERARQALKEPAIGGREPER